nr:hypothetical protein [candidate division Zixibacteria bacterium]
MEENTVTIRRPVRHQRLTNSFFLKYGLKFLLGFIIISIFLTTVRCTIKKPESPTWTTNLTIPTVNRTYLMPEIIDKIDQPGLTIDTLTGDIMYTFETELDTIDVSEDLSSPQTTRVISNTVGLVTINPDEPPPSTVSAFDIGLGLGIGDIPFGWLPDMVVNVPDIDGFSWANITSGAVYVRIVNDFPVDFDTVRVELFDLITSQTITTASFPNYPGQPAIEAGATDSIQIGLSGKNISNQLRLIIYAFTTGGSGLSLSESQISSSVSFANGLIVSAAQAEVPEIVKDFSEAFTVSSEHTVTSAIIESGNVQFTLQNGSNINANLDITIPDFSLGGIPFSINRTVLANNTSVVNIDLAGYDFSPSDQTMPQAVDINVSARIDSTAPNEVLIYSTDAFLVTSFISRLDFSSLTGIIDSTEATFDDIDVDVDLPKGFDSLQLVSAVLEVAIENAIEFPGALDITITGDGGQTLNIAGIIDPGTSANPVTTYIIDSNLAAFLNPVPAYLTVSGLAYFGDGSSSGTITTQSHIVPRLRLTSPLELIINRATFAGDTTSEDIDTEDIDLVTDHLIEATFTPTIINHLPIGVEVEFYMDGNPDHLNAEQARVVIGPLAVEAGQVASGNTVTEATESVLSIVLDSSDAQVLNNENIYTTQTITLVGSAGQPVKITGTDYVTVQGLVEVEYKFDGEF